MRLNRRFELILSNILSEFIAGNCTNEVTIEVSFTETDEFIGDELKPIELRYQSRHLK